MTSRGEHAAQQDARPRLRARHQPGHRRPCAGLKVDRSAVRRARQRGPGRTSRRIACDDTVVGLMLTNPNTLGLFDENVVEICRLVHDAGGLVYGDGANLNAILGIARPGDLGFDVMHFNLHKTFSTPHGGGGPGVGPGRRQERSWPLTCRGRSWRGTTRMSTSGTCRRRASAGSRRSTATSACWCGPTPTSACSAPRACAR